MAMMTDSELKAAALRLADGPNVETIDDLGGANPVLLMIGFALLIFPNNEPDWREVRRFMDFADEIVAVDKAKKA